MIAGTTNIVRVRVTNEFYLKRGTCFFKRLSCLLNVVVISTYRVILELLRSITGWTGRKCEDQIDECESNPCQNGGVCIDIHADYMCACTYGKLGIS